MIGSWSKMTYPSRGYMGQCQSDVESDDIDWRYMAEWGYEHRLTVRFYHVVHVPFKLSRTSTSFKFSQASTSSSVLTTLDICQHDAKSFVSITESQKLWIGSFSDHDALDEKRNYSMRFQFLSQPDMYVASVRWVVTSAVLGDWSTQPRITYAKVLIWTKYEAWQCMLFHSMSNGATCKHTGLVVSHNKLDVRMHVPNEYGVLYAKRFGRLLGIKV